MPVLPIDERRYATPEMSRVFKESTRLQIMLNVEAALAWAHSEVGNIPVKDAKIIAEKASIKNVKLDRIKEIELDTKHDVVALVRVLSEVCGSSGAFVHLGATSSDITDTATALQLKDALELIENKLDDFQDALRHKIAESIALTIYKETFPDTFSIPASQFNNWKDETLRNLERLKECKKRILVGKMSGAVGTQAAFGIHAEKIQELVMNQLGIIAAEISTQIIQRDRHAELVCILTQIATSLEKFATVILMIQRPEGEQRPEYLQTPFAQKTSVPDVDVFDDCGTICSLARFVRSLLIPALENMSIKHEQDLTQSSSERFIIPEACILVDYMLFSMKRIIDSLQGNRLAR